MSTLNVVKHVYKSYKNVGSVWFALATELIKLFIYKCFLIVLLANIVISIIFQKDPISEICNFMLWLVFGIAIGSIGEYFFVKNTNQKYKDLAKDFHWTIFHQNINFFRNLDVSQIHGLYRDHLDGTIRMIRLLRGDLFNALSSSIFPILVLAFYDTAIAASLLILCSIQAFLVYWTSKKVKALRKEAISKYKEINSKVADQILNYVAVKSGVQEIRLNEEIYALASEEEALFSARHKFENSSEVVKLLMSISIISLTMYLVSMQDLNIEELSQLAIILALYLVQIFYVVSDTPELIKKTNEHIERLNATLYLAPAHPFENSSLSTRKETSKTNNKVISVQNLNFNYLTEKGERKVIFKDFKLEIKSGSSVAILGESGRGKSTLALLLLGFYEVGKQQIYINGIEINVLGELGARSLITFTPQQPPMFSGTIRENIAFYNITASMDEINKAARAACIDEYIEQLPDKYETDIGSLGDKLSGGQKQRIAIARALLRKSPVYIFDESSSAMQEELSSKVTENILRYLKGKTILFLTHDPIIYNLLEEKVVIN